MLERYGALLSEVLYYLPGIIGRAVVAYYHLVGQSSLAQYRVKTQAQGVRAIVGGDNEADGHRRYLLLYLHIAVPSPASTVSLIASTATGMRSSTILRSSAGNLPST